MRRLLIAVSALALASCGSGGGSSAPPSSNTPTPTPVSTPTPTPSPTPTSSPTPTPTPTPTGVTEFNALTGSTPLATANSGFISQPSPTGGTRTQSVGVNGYPDGVRYVYDPQARTLVVDNGPGSPTFVASEIDTSAPAGTIRYVKSSGERAILQQPVAGGVGLRWTRFIEHSLANSSQTRTVAVTGVPTPATQIPTSGSVAFTRTVVIGEASVLSAGQSPVTYSLTPSTLTTTVDYTTRRITFTLALVGRPTAGGADVNFVTISGSTDFATTVSAVQYGTTTYTQNREFLLGAVLFGTAGAEAGGVFVFRGNSSTAGIDLVGRFGAAQ